MREMSKMEVLREIRVDTSKAGCYVREKSSFHVNLNGLTPNYDERDKVFVRLENLTITERQKNVKFFMFFGEDKNFLKKEEIRHFELNYTSIEDLCKQLNCLVCNNFVYTTVCGEYKEASVKVRPEADSGVALEANGSSNDSAVTVNGAAAAAGDANSTAAAVAVDANPTAAAAAGDANPTAAAARPGEVVVNGPNVDIKADGKNVNSNLVANYDLRRSKSGVSWKNKAEELFNVSYNENRVKLEMAQGMMFFANCPLFLALGFYDEVSQLTNFQGNSKDDCMSDSEKMSLKICRSISLSGLVQFLDEKDKICHIEFKTLIEPTFFYAGNTYSILSSYNFETKKLICHTKRISSCRRIEELNFCLYNNAFSRFDTSSVKKFSISFDLIIFKKI